MRIIVKLKAMDGHLEQTSEMYSTEKLFICAGTMQSADRDIYVNSEIRYFQISPPLKTQSIEEEEKLC